MLSGDHIYKMNYDMMLEEHMKNNADCTIAVIDVPMEEASRFGIMSTDSEGRVTEFAEKPEHPKSTQASMGVYIFSTKKLMEYLEADENDPSSENDFGKNVIPAMLDGGEKLYAYLYKGYWKDVGTLSSFWSANMDTLGNDPVLRLNDDGWRIYYRHSFDAPQYLGETADVTNCNCGDGNEINGKVESSILFNNIQIAKGASVKDSVIMSDVVIDEGATIEYAIVDRNAHITKDAKVTGNKETGELAVIHADETVEGVK